MALPIAGYTAVAWLTWPRDPTPTPSALSATVVRAAVRGFVGSDGADADRRRMGQHDHQHHGQHPDERPPVPSPQPHGRADDEQHDPDQQRQQFRRRCEDAVDHLRPGSPSQHLPRRTEVASWSTRTEEGPSGHRRHRPKAWALAPGAQPQRDHPGPRVLRVRIPALRAPGPSGVDPWAGTQLLATVDVCRGSKGVRWSIPGLEPRHGPPVRTGRLHRVRADRAGVCAVSRSGATSCARGSRSVSGMRTSTARRYATPRAPSPPGWDCRP